MLARAHPGERDVMRVTFLAFVRNFYRGDRDMSLRLRGA